MSNKYSKTAEEILKAVGGTANISSVTHCITRLRFNLKDQSIPNDEEVEKITGVAGVMRSAGQYQVVIGQTVEKVYDEVQKLGNFVNSNNSKNTQESKKEKLTLKGVGNAILNALSGSLTPLIPMLIAAAMFKTLVAVLGPDMLGILNADSDIYTLFTFVGDAAFYFLPVILGYTASKTFGVNPVLGMFMGAIMLHPTLIELVNAGEGFKVFGIPCSLQNYSATLVPIILTVWIMSYVEKFFNKYVPAMLKVVFAPFLTILVMLPLTLCVLGPAGAFIGNYICNGLIAMSSVGGIAAIITTGLIGALWEFLVMSGMHWVLLSTLLVVLSSAGEESVILPAAVVAGFAVGGMCLGAALRQKGDARSLSITYIVTQVVGGVTEPALYGVGFGYKKPFIGMAAGGFAGAIYAAIAGVTTYNLIPVASFLCVFCYTGGTTANLVNGVISMVIAFVVAAVVTYIIGIEKNTSK